MPTISSVTARQILDSRGHPTVEATVTLSDGTIASSSSPTGSIHDETVEAVQLHDSDKQDYFGLGVSRAVGHVNNEINQALIGQDPLYQTKVDQILVNLDGTKNKAKLGGNAILSVSQAVMKAAAASLRLPLFVYVKEKYQLIDSYRIPTPIFNLVNGGKHGGGTLDFQEFQLVPASHLPFTESLQVGVEVFMAIEKVLEQKGALRTVGLEGGFSPNLATNTDALDILGEATKLTRYNLSKDAFLGIDLGPQSFYKNSKYTIKDRTQPMNNREFIKYLRTLHEQYRVFSFEDPLVPKDWDGWKELIKELGSTAMIMADDLVLTNKTLLMKAVEEQAANALVIKPNRAGTVTETIEVASLARQAGWHTVMSHRSGETNDDFLSDLAVGIGTDYVKFGAPSRGERVTKYNRLLRIEEILRAAQTGATPASETNIPATTPMNTSPHPASSPTQNEGRNFMSDEPQANAPATPQPTTHVPTSPNSQTSTPTATPGASGTVAGSPASPEPDSGPFPSAPAVVPQTTTPTASAAPVAPESSGSELSVDQMSDSSAPANTPTVPVPPTTPQPLSPSGMAPAQPAQDTPTMHPNPTSPPASQPSAQPAVNPAPAPATPQVSPVVPSTGTPVADNQVESLVAEPTTETNLLPPLSIDETSGVGVASGGPAAPTSSQQSPGEQPNTTVPTSPSKVPPSTPAESDDIQASLDELAQKAATVPSSGTPSQQTNTGSPSQPEPPAPTSAVTPPSTSTTGPANLPKPTPPVASAPAQAVGDQMPQKELPGNTDTQSSNENSSGLKPPMPPGSTT